MTEWFDIPGYEGLYEITARGEVRNAKTRNYLNGNVNSHGYIVVSLTKNGKKKDCKLHRLLALTFLPNPSDFDCINHKDGNKLNNSLDNLEWCTNLCQSRKSKRLCGKSPCWKTKSQFYKRNYKNIPLTFSEIGGIFYATFSDFLRLSRSSRGRNEIIRKFRTVAADLLPPCPA